MGIFRQFPYSNFHDMNMDTVLRIMREMQDEWAATKTEWASYKDFIDNYFANLDVSEEVLQAIRVLADDGTLLTLVSPTVASSVTEWLDENITPTTPIIDASLSTQGAGADALITGDFFNRINVMNEKGYSPILEPLVAGSVDADTGARTTSTNNYCWNVEQPIGSYIYVNIDTGYRYRLVWYDENHVKQASTGWHTDSGRYFNASNLSFINIVIQKQPIEAVAAITVEAHYAAGTIINKAVPEYVPLLATGTDLNDYDVTGEYQLGRNNTYTNSPVAGLDAVLSVYRRENSTFTIQKITAWYGSGDTYFRIKSGAPATWKQWQNISANNRVLYDTEDHSNSTTPNTGEKIKVLSYNVANYNNDTAVYLPAQKRYNFIKMLYETDADILAIQEDHEFIDNVSKSAHDYLYAPKYPVEYGTSVNTIRSKTSAAHNYGMFWLSDNLYTFRAAGYSVNNKDLLILCVHPVANYNNTGNDSAETIAIRRAEYDDIFKWVNGEITLNHYPDNTPTSPPEWDYCIVAGDFNSITDADRLNLKTIAESKNFTLANGGKIGWLETCRTTSGILIYSLDNIICSDNIIIENVTAYDTLYPDLYSDHVPVKAELTLL